MQVNFPLDIDTFESTENLSVALHQRLIGFGSSFVLATGRTKSANYAERLLTAGGQTPAYKITLDDNSVSNVYAAERELHNLSPKFLVAVGGGKVADFGKRLAYCANIPLLLIPTIIANDGLISPIAVLQDRGMSISLPGRMPDIVMIDLGLIGRSPPRYLRSAACDLITNLSATNDWERATTGMTGRMHLLALHLARMAAHQILHCSDWRLDSPSFLKTIIYGQMLSGIAMTLAGSSRPCSGSEHLIAHALDAMGLGMDTLHGEKVGIAARFCLHLQQVSEARLETFFDHFQVSKILPGCSGMNEDQMTAIFAQARIMRPGRTTIIDSFTDRMLTQRYIDYIASE